MRKPCILLNNVLLTKQPYTPPSVYIRASTLRPAWDGGVRQASSASKSLTDHQEIVADVAKSVSHYFNAKEKFRIFHGSTNSTRPRSHSHARVVDTSKLRRVLHVDQEKETALVEPNVPMDRLVEETLKYGLVPPVVMEFPGITVGGGYSGTSGESSSFKHGFFDRTINSVEMVLANGTITHCSPDEKADLFHGATGALGTLGVTTMVELQLQKATTYVETTYHAVTSVTEAVERIEQFTESADVDYVDGILFSPTSGAIVTGKMTDKPTSKVPVQTFSNARDPWFYLHVQDRISTSAADQPVTELVPLAEYLFRYDRGGFWVGASAFDYFSFPFNRFTRWFLDDFLHTRMMYTALHASGQSKNYIVQDLALPYSTAAEFIDYTDRTFNIWPLWLCPLKQSPMPTMHPHTDELTPTGEPRNMLNIGLWGPGPQSAMNKPEEFVRLNKDLERTLKSLGGMKWLYAHTYYDEDEFWGDFDRAWYERLREKYNANVNLPSVYEKVRAEKPVSNGAGTDDGSGTSFLDKVRSIWPFAGFYGIRKAIQSKTYFEARRATWRWKTGKR